MLDISTDSIIEEQNVPSASRPSIDEMLADDFEPNALVFIDDRPFKFLKKPPGCQPHHFYDQQNEKVEMFWTTQLFEFMEQGRYYYPGSNSTSEPVSAGAKPSTQREKNERLSRIFLAFRANSRAKADVKNRYVAHFLNKQKLAPKDEPFYRNKNNAALVIAEVDKEIDELNSAEPKQEKWIHKPKNRSSSSLLRWIKRELAMNIGAASQIHKNAIKRRERKFPTVVYAKIAEAIREAVHVSHKIGPGKILILANAKIKEYEDRHQVKLPRPKIGVVQSEYRRFDAWIRMAKEEGVDKADLEYGAVGKLVRPARINDLVELDHHKFDLHGIFGTTPLGKAVSTTGLDRFWVCVAFDAHSGYPTGFAITFEPGGLLPALLCIDHSMRRKSYVKSRWPDIDGELLGFGKPVRFRYDNAKEFISYQIKNVLGRVGVGFQLARPGHGDSKPYVERFNGTLEQDFVHWLKGTTLSNTQQKGNRKPADEAKIPWEQFEMLFHQWLIEVYARRPQEGLEWDTPEERWRRGLQSESHRPRPLTKAQLDMWDLVTSIEVKVKARREGFRWRSLWYQSPELQHIRRQSGDRGQRTDSATLLTVRIPLLDVSKAYVANPFGDRSKKDLLPKEIVVPCTNPYVAGRTVWQHEVVCNFLRNKKNNRDLPQDPESHADYRTGFLRLFSNALEIMGVSKVGDPPKIGRLSGGSAPRFVGAFLAGPTQHALKLVEDVIERHDLLSDLATSINAPPPTHEDMPPPPKRRPSERHWKAHKIDLPEGFFDALLTDDDEEAAAK